MADKIELYRYCLGNPKTTNDQLYEIFHIEDDEEKEHVKHWKGDILQVLSIIDNPNKVKQPERSVIKEDLKPGDEIMPFLNSKKGALVNMINWWESQNREGNKKLLPDHKIDITGECKRHTLHLNIDLLKRAKEQAVKQKISLSRLVNLILNKFLIDGE